jgi:hypothetical protein
MGDFPCQQALKLEALPVTRRRRGDPLSQPQLDGGRRALRPAQLPPVPIELVTLGVARCCKNLDGRGRSFLYLLGSTTIIQDCSDSRCCAL